MFKTINAKRLYLLAIKQWFENRKAYMLFFLAITALLSGWFIFFLMAGSPYLFAQDNQLVIYFGGLFVAGCLSASFLFNDFIAKPRKINFHLLPAAAIEKLLCALFYGVLVFFIAYTAIFYLTDTLAVNLSNNATGAMLRDHSEHAMHWKQQFGITNQWYNTKVVNVFNPSAEMFIFYPGDTMDIFTAYFPIQSAFILGAVYFKKNGFFKTIVALLLIFLVFFIIESKLLFPLLPDAVKTLRVGTIAELTDKNGNEKIYTLPFWIGSVMGFLLKFALTPALWAATYYRLKETEI